MSQMKCFHPDCPKAAPQNTLYRINAKGVPGIWACLDHKHLSDRKPDTEIEKIVAAVESAGPTSTAQLPFVTFLHQFRAQVNAKPVTDEVAMQAYDMIEDFIAKWRAAP